MKEKLNKPRVFLSHSKKDLVFIERLDKDLRRCQVEPWLDDYGIRHGQPWLTAIFEEGIPTCDAVVAYLTEHSIISPVVQKEIDVGILQKLKDNSVAFLPYVAQEDLRSRLRPDLQTLQCLEWNDANYAQLLPCVVAEVWRSFLERTVTHATERERVARLEAENRLLEIEKAQVASLFQQGEARGFEYIWSKLDRYEPVILHHLRGSGTSVQTIAVYSFAVHIGSLLTSISHSSNYVYQKHSVYQIVQEALEPKVPAKGSFPDDERLELSVCPNIGDELLMYGFVTRFHRGFESMGTSRAFSRLVQQPYVLMYTDTLERFKYWLAVNGRMPSKIELKTEGTSGTCP